MPPNSANCLSISKPIKRGIAPQGYTGPVVIRDHNFAGQVIKPWHTTIRRRTFNDALARTARVPVEDLFATANSYFGLLRQATHSHGDRARLANLLRDRRHAVNQALTQTYRRTA